MSVDSVPVRPTLRGAVITLPEEIDATNSEQVQAALTEAVRAAPAVLVADMTRTTFCSTAGVRALIMTHRAAEQAHTALRIAGVCKPVGRIFALLGVDAFFNVYPSVDAALTAKSNMM